MAIHYSPKIVLDGLVLYLDAANPRSYPGTGTTWKDLSKNGNDGTLTNSPTYSSDNKGSFSFDGVNDYVIVNDNSSLDISGDKSLSCWVNMGGSSSCGITGKSTSTVKGMALGYGWNGNGFMALAWNSNNNPHISKDLDRDIGKWVFLFAKQNGSIRTIYVYDSLGVRTQTFSGGVHSWDNTADFRVGDSDNVGYRAPAGTKIGLVSIYNRALTESEIKQNFEATRGRYGI